MKFGKNLIKQVSAESNIVYFPMLLYHKKWYNKYKKLYFILLNIRTYIEMVIF